MPILTISFNLPEEKEDAELAQKGCEYHSILFDLLELVRRLKKYDDRKNIPKDEIINSLEEILLDFE